MAEVNIVKVLTTGGGSLIIGLLCGGATKYLFRVVAFLAGLFISITVYMEYIDFITIEWENIGDMINLVIDTISVLGVPSQESSAEVFEVFSIVGGFVIGFLIGYRFG